MCKICSVENCNSKHYGKGYCHKHYQQFKKHGRIIDHESEERIIEYDDYAEIILYNRQYEEIARTLIDLEDIDRVKNYKWYLHDNGYVITDIKSTKKHVRLHRFIMDCPDGMVVDHINHNPLDNRKDNLRVCTQQQNMMNQSKRKDNTSGITGVHWVEGKRRKKWVARITVNKKQKTLGYYNTKEEAIEARKQAEIEYFGEFTPNNEE